MAGYTGADLIADRLIEYGMPYVFGTCGHGNIGLLEALRDRTDRITTVSVHHEAVAGFMADAYYRVTRMPVATFTSCGPGTANMPIALGAALRDAAALLAITGNVPTEQFGRQPFQELGTHYQADAVTATRPYVKRSFQATRPQQLPHMLDHARTTMLDSRPGPVQLDVPLDVFRGSASPAPSPRLGTVTGGYAPSRADVDAVLTMLRSSAAPVIIAGEQCLDEATATALAEVARLFEIPVATTPAGKGAIDARSPFSVGQTGRNGTYPANAAVRNADLLIVLGAHVDDRSSSSWLPGATLPAERVARIHVDVDTTILGLNVPADLRLVARPGLLLTALLEAAGQRPEVSRAGWLDRTVGWKRRWADRPAAKRRPAAGEHPRAVVHELRRALPEDGILLADVGVHHNWLVQEWDAYAPNTLLQSWGYASMGYGAAGVLGAALGRPDVPNVALVGDGGMLMFPSVVATAVEYGIPAVWVVWNNNAYSSIRDQQIGYFGPGHEFATTIGLGQGGCTDFALLARAMGADGVTVTDAVQLGDAVAQGVAAGRPLVIEVPVDRDTAAEATGAWTLPPLGASAIAEPWLPEND